MNSLHLPTKVWIPFSLGLGVSLISYFWRSGIVDDNLYWIVLLGAVLIVFKFFWLGCFRFAWINSFLSTHITCSTKCHNEVFALKWNRFFMHCIPFGSMMFLESIHAIIVINCYMKSARWGWCLGRTKYMSLIRSSLDIKAS